MNHFFWLILIFFGVVASVFSKPIPYVGKISLDGINFEGQANFRFTIYTDEGKALWQNGNDAKTTISASVKNGRYSVLLGGQGMNSISPELFLENEILYLSVYVDLNDGKGLSHLPPDQPIRSVPHALSADLAERAKVADEVATGAISKQMLGTPIQNQLDAPVSASRLDPSLKAYLAPLLEPKPTSTVTDRDRMEGGSVTLSAPSASGQNLSYQWKRNGTTILGATSKDLVIDDLNATLHSGNYKVVVSNDFGSFSQQLALNILRLLRYK